MVLYICAGSALTTTLKRNNQVPFLTVTKVRGSHFLLTRHRSIKELAAALMELGRLDSMGNGLVVVQPFNNSLTGIEEEFDGDSEETDDSRG